jgi:RHS repeat-associated protein
VRRFFSPAVIPPRDNIPATDMIADGSNTYFGVYPERSRSASFAPRTTRPGNAVNQLVSTAGVNYLYDGDGKRVSKSNGKLYWYGMGSNTLDETDASGNLTNEYIFFNGKRVARRDSSNNVDYYFTDHLGTARIVTSAAGAVLDDSDFYPFGGERAITSSSGNTYKFTSKERDSESGLDNFGARYFGSSVGRFMTPDWSAKPTAVPYAAFGNPQSLNLYSYVGNNPLLHFDPDGHCWPIGACAQAAMAKVNQAQQWVQNKATATGNGALAATATFTSGVTRDVVNGVLSLGTVGSATGTCMGGNGCSAGKTALAVGGDLLKAAAIAAPVVGAVAGTGGAAASEATATTQLFRAVSTAEADSIAETGAFSASPAGSMSKGFFFNESDAQSFADMATKSFEDPHTVVSTEAPTDLVNSSAPHTGVAQEGPGVYIQNENLNQLKPPKVPD